MIVVGLGFGSARPDQFLVQQFGVGKVADIEADIFERETRIDELHQALASPEVLRDGEKVKAHQAELVRLKDELQNLYEHWEEATELNW